jgi:hypothetical protein
VEELTQELLFVHDRMYRALGDYSRFQHFFHGEDLVGLLLFDFPDFSKAATADHIHEAEVILSDLYNISIRNLN